MMVGATNVHSHGETADHTHTDDAAPTASATDEHTHTSDPASSDHAHTSEPATSDHTHSSRAGDHGPRPRRRGRHRGGVAAAGTRRRRSTSPASPASRAEQQARAETLVASTLARPAAVRRRRDPAGARLPLDRRRRHRVRALHQRRLHRRRLVPRPDPPGVARLPGRRRRRARSCRRCSSPRTRRRRPRARRLGRAADAVARPREPVLVARRERPAEGRRASPTPTASAPPGSVNAGGENPMVHVWIAPHECGPFAALEGHGAGQAATRRPARRPVRPRPRRRLAAETATAAYDPTKPIDLSGVEGVTPEQQAYAENLVAVTLVGLPQWADPAVAEAAGFHSIGDGRTGHEHYIHWDWIDDDVWLDPDAPESLVYEPQPDGSKKLVSAMYMLPHDVALADVPELGRPADAVARPRQPLLHRRSRGAAGASASRPPTARAGPRSSSIAERPMIHVWITPTPVRSRSPRSRASAPARSPRARSAGATTPTAAERLLATPICERLERVLGVLTLSLIAGLMVWAVVSARAASRRPQAAEPELPGVDPLDVADLGARFSDVAAEHAASRDALLLAHLQPLVARKVPVRSIEPVPELRTVQGSLRRRHGRRRARRGGGRRRRAGVRAARPPGAAERLLDRRRRDAPRVRLVRRPQSCRHAGRRSRSTRVIDACRPISTGERSPTTPRGSSTGARSAGGRRPPAPPARPPAGSQPDHPRPPAAGTARPDGRHPPRRRRRAVVLAAQARPRRPATRPSCRGACGCAAEALGPTFIKLGQIISSGEGLFPPELVEEFKRCRDQVPAEPFDVVRRTVEADLGRPLEDVFESFDVRAARRRVDRPGPRRPAAHRRGRRRQGAAPRRRPPRAPPTCGRWRGWPRTSSGASRSPRWPTRRRSSSCSPTRSSRSSTSASRPPTCSTSRRCCASSSRPATSCPARIPALVTRRVLVMQRLDGFKFDDVAGMREAGVDTESGGAHGDGRPDGGGDDQRHLPRRPPRRQPARARRRAHRPARLRHRRPSGRRAPGGLPAADGRGDDQRPEGADGRPARPRRAAAGHRPAGGDPRPRPRPGARRPDDADRRPAGQGGPARRQGPARLRRADAQGADAVRQEPRVPRRRHRPPGPRPRHPRRDRQHLRALRHSATASSSAASSASASTSRPSTSTASRPGSASTRASNGSPTASCRPAAP